MRAADILIFIVGVCVIALLTIRDCTHPTPIQTGKTVTVHDTLVHIVPETVYVYRKAAAVRIVDTVAVYVQNPFVATADTVIDKIAVNDTFFFPEMRFSTKITKKADSIVYIEKSYYRTDTLNAPVSTWQSTASNVLSLLIGFLVGSQVK